MLLYDSQNGCINNVDQFYNSLQNCEIMQTLQSLVSNGLWSTTKIKHQALKIIRLFQISYSFTRSAQLKLLGHSKSNRGKWSSYRNDSWEVQNLKSKSKMGPDSQINSSIASTSYCYIFSFFNFYWGTWCDSTGQKDGQIFPEKYYSKCKT